MFNTQFDIGMLRWKDEWDKAESHFVVLCIVCWKSEFTGHAIVQINHVSSFIIF